MCVSSEVDQDTKELLADIFGAKVQKYPQEIRNFFDNPYSIDEKQDESKQENSSVDVNAHKSDALGELSQIIKMDS